MAKTMSLRIADEVAAALEMVARAEDTSVTETIREAINDAIERRRADPEFQARLRKIRERDAQTLRILAER